MTASLSKWCPANRPTSLFAPSRSRASFSSASFSIPMANRWRSIIWTARASSNVPSCPRSGRFAAGRALRRSVLALAWLLVGLDTAAACPFCTVPQPTLAQRRDEAAVVVLAQTTTSTSQTCELRLLQVLKGKEKLEQRETLSLPPQADAKTGGLLVVFGRWTASPDGDRLGWEIVPVDETSYAYLVRAPRRACRRQNDCRTSFVISNMPTRPWPTTLMVSSAGHRMTRWPKSANSCRWINCATGS